MTVSHTKPTVARIWRGRTTPEKADEYADYSYEYGKVDLHPLGFTESYAFGVSTINQVGYGTTDAGAARAVLWSGTAASRVDLNPAGMTFSEALAISAAGQVGSASGPSTDNNAHAFWWQNTAASAVDLHPLLADLGIDFVSSTATGIADNGMIVRYALDEEQNSHAVMWTPLFGDYNDDGHVDAADYVVWRKSGTTLRNEYVTVGTKNTADYDAWRNFFGGSPTADANPTDAAPVPEPSNVLWSLLVVLWSSRKSTLLPL